MSENRQAPIPRDPDSWLAPGERNLQLIYALYILSFVFGITSLIAIVMAYVNRGKAGGWMESHYTFAIRTFWIGLLYAVIASILTLVLIGVILGLLTAIWLIARCVVGLQKVGAGEPIGNPKTWFIDR
ncbi:DUF4870 family protein [Rhizobium halophytocola]|uniref:Membrane protein n=1 Tax=Rhizobium halophytocola TaxID=735519 RepID=A0ABS4DXY5_9HYPH|nr:hypothetical protein [Rhizobium halophytocola]MBP1850489.1 putative membrane protein [Rhizobium halophytocola]